MSIVLTRALQVRRELAALCVAAASLLCATALAQNAPTLSLADALRLAQERSRGLAAQDAAVAAAREMAVAAGQRPDPVLRAGINNLPIDGPDRFTLTRDFMTMRALGVAQELTRADKLQARSDRFEREAQAAGAARALALANLRRDTALAWLERSLQERLRALLLQQREQAALQIDAAEAAYRGGRGAQGDVFAARLGVAQLDDRIAQTERQAASATTGLARWIGSAAAQPLAEAPAADTVALQLAELEDRLAHHPQIELLAQREAVAQAEAQVARSNRKPDWNVELMFSQRGPAYSNMLSLNLSVPLQWDRANRQDRELGARLALAQQLGAEREEATRAHVAEAAAMLQEWQAERARLARYDQTLVPLAGERTRAAITAYRSNTGPLSAVLEARRAELDIGIERLRLEGDAARLWAQLNFMIPARAEATTTRGVRSIE